MRTLSDITEQRSLEEQLRQSQKMEAIGQLSGGVAHDLNNILMIINGYSLMLLNSDGLSADAIEGLKQIYLAGERAANLTQQLFTFSRQQAVQLKVIDLDNTVTGMAKVLESAGLSGNAARRPDRVIGPLCLCSS